jgi:hypothetical protein
VHRTHLTEVAASSRVRHSTDVAPEGKPEESDVLVDFREQEAEEEEGVARVWLSWRTPSVLSAVHAGSASRP